MNSIKQLQKLRMLHQWIHEESSGSPDQIASRLQISQRQVYLLLEMLKDMGAPIVYNRSATTYYYKHAFELEILIKVRVIDHNNQTHIYAGFNHSFNYSQYCKVTAVCYANLQPSRLSPDVGGLDVTEF